MGDLVERLQADGRSWLNGPRVPRFWRPARFYVERTARLELEAAEEIERLNKQVESLLPYERIVPFMVRHEGGNLQIPVGIAWLESAEETDYRVIWHHSVKCDDNEGEDQPLMKARWRDVDVPLLGRWPNNRFLRIRSEATVDLHPSVLHYPGSVRLGEWRVEWHPEEK